MAECALCFNVYSWLAPHLTTVHKVTNSDEKRLLLALAAGRVDTQKTLCPVPGCRRTPARLDSHLRQHAELSTLVRKETMGRLKRQKGARELQWLQSTQPAIPVVSRLASSSGEERDSKGPEPGRPCADCGCRRATERIQAQLIDLGKQIESNPSTRQQWRFYGFLTGYLTSISGHRCGVFQNLTIQEVEEASRSPDESAYVINITTHKTNRAFGAAQLSLNREEYSWFRRFLALQAGLPGESQATYFFFTSRANPFRTLNKYFQSAWISMGLPGKPTFTDVRTAIATHAKNAHSSEDRRKVAQFMCHDTSTSDKFYTLHLGPFQAHERRRLFERALVEEEEEDREAAGTESPPRKGRKRTETPVSPLEGTSRRTLPWRPARGKSQGARLLEPTEDFESS
ncbi:uncharacterized protein [Danio rerio]|uniref:Uncharacterized protein n=1 Tax=Danio rerio TaxID=7955 RepID=A0AC58GB87_DANRE